MVVAAGAEARKVVSVVFADLVGFTSHTEQSDPEDVRARLTVYHERVRDDIERFGGRVEKLMGDGVFSVFGAPTAHEDDPERAVRAALRVQESVAQLNERGLDLAVRIAVTTGEAMVQLDPTGAREGIVGDVVNTASRLEAVAPPGGVVVDQTTYLAARAAIDFDALDPVVVKGKSEPQVIWLAASAKSRFGVAVEEHDLTPFVGRDRELAVLVDGFERVIAEQTIQLVTIAGEPGSGKSRLLRELGNVADDRPDLIYWRQGRCLPYGEGITFWAIGEIVKAHAGILDGEAPADAAVKLRTAIEAHFSDVSDIAWVERSLGPLAGLASDGGTVDRGELFAAARALFEAMAEVRPLVLVIEDLHWADPALVEFIVHMLDWAVSSPILLICTARPELYATHPDWGGGKRNALTVTLAPLTDDATSALLSRLLPSHLMTADRRLELLERCGGNPLYAIEYARLAHEGGGETLPATVHALIAARLDLLEPEEKAYLQAAAVVGKVFWSAAVDFMLPGGARDAPSLLRRLTAREMIRPVRRASMRGQEEFAFWHVLVRDVAYGEIPRGERARLHEAVATWLEAVAAERLVDVAEVLMHHYGEAIDLHSASGEDRPDLASRAYRFALMAADRVRQLDSQRAVRFLERAVRLASTERELAGAYVELSPVQLDAGHLADAEASARAALEAFENARDVLGQAEALSEVGRARWIRGDGAESLEMSLRALDLVVDLDPHPTVARVIVGHSGALMLRGREDEAREWGERGLEMARQLGETETIAKAISIVAVTRIRPGDLQGLDMLRELLDFCKDRGLTRQTLTAINNLTTSLQYIEGPDAALELIEEAIELADQRGAEGSGMFSRGTRLEHLELAGRFDEVISVADAIIRWDDAKGGSQIGSIARMHLVSALTLTGDVTGARRLLDGALADAHDAKDPQALAPMLATAAFTLHAAGDTSKTRELAEEFKRVTEEALSWRASFTYAFADPLVEAGHSGVLAELSRQTRIYSEILESRNDAIVARLAEHEGDAEGAVSLLQRSVSIADEFGVRVDAVLFRIQLARCLRHLGKDAAAIERLDEARIAAESMGAGLLVSRIEDLAQSDTEAIEA